MPNDGWADVMAITKWSISGRWADVIAITKWSISARRIRLGGVARWIWVHLPYSDASRSFSRPLPARAGRSRPGLGPAPGCVAQLFRFARCIES